MHVIDNMLDGALLLEPNLFGDQRGWFYEAYNKVTFETLTGYGGDFLQDNHSLSIKGVIRGIHYQLPRPQGKLIRCLRGAVWDVVVDLRKHSSSFGEWAAVELDDENQHLLWIPAGFGHGFAVVSDEAEVFYKTTEFWDSACDRAIRWNDPTLSISWPFRKDAIVSDKDNTAPLLEKAVVFD